MRKSYTAQKATSGYELARMSGPGHPGTDEPVSTQTQETDSILAPKRPLQSLEWHDTGLLHRNVQRFRGGLVFKAHRLMYHSTLGLRVIKKMIPGAFAGFPA